MSFAEGLLAQCQARISRVLAGEEEADPTSLAEDFGAVARHLSECAAAARELERLARSAGNDLAQLVVVNLEIDGMRQDAAQATAAFHRRSE